MISGNCLFISFRIYDSILDAVFFGALLQIAILRSSSSNHPSFNLLPAIGDDQMATAKYTPSNFAA